MSTRHIDTVDVAKMVRRALKENFPGTKFSVRSSRYSGGSSIRASWVDGPPRKTVSNLCNLYQGSDFDPMVDLKTGRETVLVGENGPEVVSMGADWVFAEREISAQYYEMARAWWSLKVFFPQADKRSGGRADVHPAPDDSDGWLDTLSVACDNDLDREIIKRWSNWQGWGSSMVRCIAEAIADIEYEGLPR